MSEWKKEPMIRFEVELPESVVKKMAQELRVDSEKVTGNDVAALLTRSLHTFQILSAFQQKKKPERGR